MFLLGKLHHKPLLFRSSWAAAPKRAFVVPVTFACEGRSAAAGAPTGF